MNIDGNTHKDNNDADVDVDTTTASEIETQPIVWAYEPFIPIGTVTVLIGDGGEGKSFYSLALAAAISRGWPLPGLEKAALPPSDVIVMNAENPWPSVIKPRLELLGADSTKIHRINDSNKRLTLTDNRIEAAIRKHKAKLTIIDPLQAYFSENFSMNRSESIRPAFMHLEKVAERTESAILLLGHISKGRGKAQHRGLGSVDIVNSVPSVMVLGKAESLDSDVRAICHLKSNFAELGVAHLFRLNKAEGFSWAGEDDSITPDDIMRFNAVRAKEDKTKIDEAMDFLEELLADGEVPATEAIELANDEGISKRTLDRARKQIGVKPKKVDGHWVWMLLD
ncbi:MAG: AAA family ATPase [Defluviitaleaceae bacterium]|nr:AAA family ATPase [Defluviitaleaceae bacterium]